MRKKTCVGSSILPAILIMFLPFFPIADADPDARSFARKAYWGFADHFKDQADQLLNSLDGVHRR